MKVKYLKKHNGEEKKQTCDNDTLHLAEEKKSSGVRAR